MESNRRAVLATVSAAVAPMLAGCTPCGDPFPAAGFDVRPTAIDRPNETGWRIETELEIEFLNPRSDFGLANAALAAFDATGRVVDTDPIGDLRWTDVPAEHRESGECADSGTLRRRGTVQCETIPQWVGLRYDAFEGRNQSMYPTTVAAKTPAGPDRSDNRSSERPTDPESPSTESNETPDADPDPDRDAGPASVSASAYESTSVSEIRGGRQRATPSRSVTDLSFRTDRPYCVDQRENRDPHLESRNSRSIRFEWARPLPADRFWPVLLGLSRRSDELVLDIGWRTAPRFRRLPCPESGQPYTVSVSFRDASTVPAAVRVRHRDEAGTVVRERTVRRE